DDKQDDSSQEIKDSDRQEGSSQETGADDADDADDDNNKEDETDKNNTEENIVYNFSDEIVISEIYPNPEGRDNRDGNYEWIELYNCSPQDVNLIGWQIDDILRKGSKSYTIKENKIIKAKSQLIFTNEETKVIFNNSGDEVNLLWSDGTVVDSVSYGKSAEGQSYNWINGNWSWSKTITPNKNNLADITGKILSAESVANSNNEDEIEIEIDESDMDIEEDLISEIEYTEITIIEAKKLPRFSEVKITGVVSTPPGIFSDDIFYITGSGIQIYGKNIDISKINIGDEIKIAGQISEVGGEKRILLNKAENIKIISSDNLVESRVISIADVGEDNEGYLVTIEGKVAEIKNDVFFLSDKNERIKIYLKPQAGIEKSRIEINKWMAITGQVSRTSAGYRILPRFQADLKFGRVSGIAMASADLIGQENGFIDDNKNERSLLFSEGGTNSVIYAIIVLMGLIVLIDWGRMRVIKSKK
ncbi:MAG: lamin tail domain-containing protein, partial [Patescibacteria group bacterium]|nr:lamin tail domain-containing protein [Patescibacteria group bacterium]